MKGERLIWFKLARRQGMSLQRFQQETTSSEFMDWQVEMQMEWSDRKPEYWYLAQIAREIRAVLSKHPNQVKVDQFILKFQEGNEELSKEQYEQRSKGFWASILGPMAGMMSKARRSFEGIRRNDNHNP